jgi:Uma2 family endonuclease
MSQANPEPEETVDRLRLSGVSWKDYSRFLCLFAERPGHHLTYDRGELEITGTWLGHERDKLVLGRMVDTLTEELGREMIGGGATTLRLRTLRRGLDPDGCYWIDSASRMAGKRRLNLRRDPAPDLVIKVSNPEATLNRARILARLGVPEVWQLQGDSLSFLVRQGSNFAKATHSLSFPFLTPADLITLILQSRDGGGENAVIGTLRNWVQQRRSG